MQTECIIMTCQDTRSADELVQSLHLLQRNRGICLINTAVLVRYHDGAINMTRLDNNHTQHDEVPLDITEDTLYTFLMSLKFPHTSLQDVQHMLKPGQVLVVALINGAVPEQLERAVRQSGGTISRYRLEDGRMRHLIETQALINQRRERLQTQAELAWQAHVDKLEAQLRACNADIDQLRSHLHTLRGAESRVQLIERMAVLCNRRDAIRDELHTKISAQMQQWDADFCLMRARVRLASEPVRTEADALAAALRSKLDAASRRMQISLEMRVNEWQHDIAELERQLATADTSERSRLGQAIARLRNQLLTTRQELQALLHSEGSIPVELVSGTGYECGS